MTSIFLSFLGVAFAFASFGLLVCAEPTASAVLSTNVRLAPVRMHPSGDARAFAFSTSSGGLAALLPDAGGDFAFRFRRGEDASSRSIQEFQEIR